MSADIKEGIKKVSAFQDAFKKFESTTDIHLSVAELTIFFATNLHYLVTESYMRNKTINEIIISLERLIIESVERAKEELTK